ncbi:hypothetical protein Tsubulata_035849 [Turnera subulata]|uniref:BHLH domain-containing protein n=1 Tax=Turnera subulata TaxID=218843 RepID=A0A9Q0GJQ5_9ROSI|nr:hypothetical protein Tsubulata_035849 [Turnera subulata]
MAEEFQAGICGENWWNPSKSVFMGGGGVGGGGLSPCSVVNTSDMGTYGSWMTTDHMLDLKPRSCKEANHTAATDSAIAFQNSLKAHHHHDQADSDSGGSTILMDSSLQMMGFGLSSSSSSSSDWSQALLPGSGRGADSYNSMLQEDMNQGLNSSQIQKDWSPTKSFTTTTAVDSPINAFEALNDQDFSLDQRSGNNSTPTCQGLSTGFSMESAAASYGYPSTLIQSLFEHNPPQPQQQQQQPLFNNRSMNYQLPTTNYAASLNQLSTSWSKTSPLVKPSLLKQQPSTLQFSNNAAFWNPSSTGMNDIRGSVMPSSQSQYLVPSFEEKPNCANLTTTKRNNDEVRDSGSVVKKSSEPSFKRPRIETPSPLPTFKVRKEKLGDRITALQQLVSPFGKTDTASVLHEAIECIKFLHGQVSVLSAPYMKNANHIQHQQGGDRLKEPEGKHDLKSRGLCLVPISSTFPVANETTPDFWTPTFGGTFR